MAGKRTLKQQLFNAVDSRYKVGKGRSKHQDKKNGEIKHDIIYSKNEMERLKDISSNFSKFVREKHPELWRTQLADMPVEIVNEYLKTKTHCSQNTINGYADSIKKIFRCAGAVYKTGDFTEMRYINKPLSDRDKEATLRDIALSREVHNAALNNMSKTSGGYVGNLLNGILGSRSDETVHIRAKDFNFENGTVYIWKGKNGKPRTLKIPKIDMDKIKKEIFNDGNKKFNPNQSVCGCGVDAIQKGLIRALERVDIKNGTNFAEQIKEKKTNQHAGRKMVATEKYILNVRSGKFRLIRDKLIAEHRNGKIDLSVLDNRQINAKVWDIINNREHEYINKVELLEIEEKAWSRVSIFLGHGKDRPELKSVYVITDNTKILRFP